MSSSEKQRPDESVRPRRIHSVQVPFVAWLTIVWVALWGDVSIANVVVGVLLGAAVSFVFPLPPLRMQLRVRPLRLAWLVLHFLGSVVVASLQVSILTMRLRRTPRNAVIEVDLRTASDLVLTIVAEMTSLVPGSIVVEARRSTHTLFLHVLDARDEEGVAQMRSKTFALERRVVMALGAEVDHLDLSAPTSTRRSR
ncbi:MAG TPA: Na+/H+ antiporter subunit E [Actinomycetes bacterium]|nr:Na+/H+ antiporter subunit E [Actinomycetes bacterium]